MASAIGHTDNQREDSIGTLDEAGIMKSWGIVIVVALGIFIYGALTKANRDDTGAIVGEGTVDPFNVRVGDCFDDTNDLDEISSLPGVPCSEPHDNETYAVFDIEIPTYPEGEGMWEQANAYCVERFDAFVGRDYDSSSLDVFTLYPTLESWKRDDREVVCAVYDMEENKLVGSVMGQGL